MSVTSTNELVKEVTTTGRASEAKQDTSGGDTKTETEGARLRRHVTGLTEISQHTHQTTITDPARMTSNINHGTALSVFLPSANQISGAESGTGTETQSLAQPSPPKPMGKAEAKQPQVKPIA